VSVAAPPMQGLTVTAVRAAAGTRVRAGDALLELEDARSVYELAAPVAGEVHEVLVDEGDEVIASATLVRLRIQ
jgi:biotin carboxyl carrier protein